jgi:GAF domain-containing protein
MSRETVLTTTLVQLADSLVDDFDVVDLLTLLAHRCVEILDVSAAGLMLAGPSGRLSVIASSSEAMRILETFEQQSGEGPCPDCYRSGLPIVNLDLTKMRDRWPEFTPRALRTGFRSVHALPLHLRETTVGALNLFRTDEGGLGEEDVSTAQALADVATIAILQHRAAVDSKALNDQLNRALNGRIVIEQAKGMVSERAGIDMEQAFALLRTHARNHNLKLVGVARVVIDGALDLDGERDTEA